MATLRWGLLGASRVARRWLLPGLQAATDQQVHAVAARDPARARDFAAELAIPLAHDNYDALLRDPDIDIVYVGLLTASHAVWTERALDAGKHVLCEKPMAVSAGEVLRMRAAAERNRRLLLEGFAYRFHPQIARMAQAVRDGEIGPLVALDSRFTMRMPDGDGTRWDASLGGGALFDVGCYCVHVMRIATGREPLRVSARADIRRGVDATLAGVLDFGDGVLATMACSYVGAPFQSLTLVGRDAVLRLARPFGSKGQEVALEIGDAVQRFPASDPTTPMVEMFGAAVRGEAALTVTPDDALAQARVLDALFASVRADGRLCAPAAAGAE
ncbi:MAG: Gfo/Idh/MocA family oxidoreductase [Acetobacteraceae bacterium]|nr:Gfo/Idh/MocA family oxidoreductase [Acetobacteraceae bacterium]